MAVEDGTHGSPASLVEAEGMCSYLVDVWVRDPEVLVSEEAMSGLLHSVAEAGKATVLGESSHVFPNGAVTAVLVLSQSHLSVHTWPEFGLANIDLLTYGRTHAELMVDEIESSFSPVRMNVSRVVRPAR